MADSAFAALYFIDAIRLHTTIIPDLSLDTALYARLRSIPGNEDAPRKKGERLTSLILVLADERTRWASLTAQFLG